MCYVMPAQVASYLWGEDFWRAFFVAGALRYAVVLHFTWFVNSAAHLYGDHPYDPMSYPAENPFVSYCAIGEGWHNWHHKYPYDYAASEHGWTSQFNPTKVRVFEVFCLPYVTVTAANSATVSDAINPPLLATRSRFARRRCS